jgi:RNA polymerase sigma-70 factor (ECF subfamily)
MSEADTLLVEQIRSGDQGAWELLIRRFEGRLMAFVQTRLRRREVSEDVVQETFLGFLNSLPHYQSNRSLEGYLFSIASHKLTDIMRREGRRPVVPIGTTATSDGQWEIPASARAVSSMMRSGERQQLEADAIAAVLQQLINHWRQSYQWQKLCCIELLFVAGWPNKTVATTLNISEQAVANYKFDFLARLRSELAKLQLSPEVFPELYEK